MKAPNPLPPNYMTPAERRAELCAILARGLVRLQMASEASDRFEESSLHNRPEQSVSRYAISREKAA